MDMNTAVSLLNIKEDLLDDEVKALEPTHTENKISKNEANGKPKPLKRKVIKFEKSTFEKLIASVTKQLGCNANEINAWLNHIPNTPGAAQLSALRLITKHKLDPFSDEIAIHQYEDGHWQTFITIDGWSKLINSHPAFSGISFTESNELIGGVPSWMGCAIYRNDRVAPIEVKEYLCETQTEHRIWKDMPRRMLRYRVISQCARLAFGVSAPENKRINQPKQKIKEGATEIKSVQIKSSQIEKLRALLK